MKIRSLLLFLSIFISVHADSSIVLEEGWNLVAPPVAGGIENQADVLGADKVYTYSNGAWVKNPDDIDEGAGFWVDASAQQEVSFTGDSYSISSLFEALSNGWHLLGDGEGFENLQSTYGFDYVYVFTNRSWSLNPVTISPGEGFWVKKGEDFSTPPIEIEATSTGAAVDANVTEDAVDFEGTAIEEVDESTLVASKTLEEAQEDVGKPIFVDGEFKGMASSVSEGTDGVTYALSDAESIGDAYENFSLLVGSDEITRSLQRAVRKARGKYDHLNPGNPVTFQVYTEPSSTRSNEEEVYLQINIPEGYKMVKPRAVESETTQSTDADINCDFYVTDCSAWVGANYQSTYYLNAESDAEDSTIISYTTKPSKITINIGSSMRVNYIKDRYQFVTGHNSSDYLFFQFYAKGNLTSELYFTVNGLGESDIEPIEYDITDGFELEIVHPYSAIAETYVFFQPSIEVGVEGSLEGSIKAHSKITRSGDYVVTYENTPEKLESNETIISENSLGESADKLDESGVEVDLSAEATGWVYPNVKVSPRVELARVSWPISMGTLRGGFKVNSKIEGEISAGFEIKGDQTDSDLDGKVTAGLYIDPLLEGKFNVSIAEKALYSSDYMSLYEGESITILDWSMQLLDDPSIDVTDNGDDTYSVSFSTTASGEDVLNAIKFYYTTNGGTPDSEQEDELWDGESFTITQSTEIKVMASLKNEDISEGYWAFGESVSNVVTQTVGKDTESSTEGSEAVLPTYTGGGTEDCDDSGTYESYYSDGTLKELTKWGDFYYSETSSCRNEISMYKLTYHENGNIATTTIYDYTKEGFYDPQNPDYFYPIKDEYNYDYAWVFVEEFDENGVLTTRKSNCTRGLTKYSGDSEPSVRTLCEDYYYYYEYSSSYTTLHSEVLTDTDGYIYSVDVNSSSYEGDYHKLTNISYELAQSDGKYYEQTQTKEVTADEGYWVGYISNQDYTYRYQQVISESVVEDGEVTEWQNLKSIAYYDPEKTMPAEVILYDSTLSSEYYKDYCQVQYYSDAQQTVAYLYERVFENTSLSSGNRWTATYNEDGSFSYCSDDEGGGSNYNDESGCLANFTGRYQECLSEL